MKVVSKNKNKTSSHICASLVGGIFMLGVVVVAQGDAVKVVPSANIGQAPMSILQANNELSFLANKIFSAPNSVANQMLQISTHMIICN